MRSARRRAAFINKIRQRMERDAVQRRKGESNYGHSDEVTAPLCPPSYHSPMTNDLRDHGMQSIEAARDEVQAVLDRTQWEFKKLTERLAELQTEPETKEERKDLSAWL